MHLEKQRIERSSVALKTRMYAKVYIRKHEPHPRRLVGQILPGLELKLYVEGYAFLLFLKTPIA